VILSAVFVGGEDHKTDTPNDHRPLADSELDAVSGGVLSFGSAATTGRAAPAVCDPLAVLPLLPLTHDLD
jgi:hypothetical protein